MSIPEYKTWKKGDLLYLRVYTDRVFDCLQICKVTRKRVAIQKNGDGADPTCWRTKGNLYATGWRLWNEDFTRLQNRTNQLRGLSHRLNQVGTLLKSDQSIDNLDFSAIEMSFDLFCMVLSNRIEAIDDEMSRNILLNSLRNIK